MACKPLSIGNGHAVGAQVQLGLQVERQQLGPLRFDDRAILLAHAILKREQLRVGNFMTVIQCHDEARLGELVIDGGDLRQDGEALISV